MFEDAVKYSIKKRGVIAANKRIKYIHFMQKNKLIGTSGNARDLLDYIQYLISTNEYNVNTKYYIYLNADFKTNYIDYLSKYNISISIPTIDRAIKELKDRHVLLPTRTEKGLLVKTKGKVLYNFKDFGHVGNQEQYQYDIQKYNIEEILKLIENK